MDDLDRLYRRLVQNIRNGFPDYLSRPFEVAEVYQSIVPYRHNRRELGIETNQDYELALCRLIAGERGYVTGDDAMQSTVRQELALANPNTAVFRDFAAARVALAPEPLRQLSVESAAAAPDREPGSGAQRAGMREAHPLPPNPPPPRPPTPPPPPSLRAPTRPSAPASPSQSIHTPVGGVRSGTQSTGVTGGACRYCNGDLPEDRRVMFCPHCGQNVTVQHCPACGAELDQSWKFCITCGRAVAAE